MMTVLLVFFICMMTAKLVGFSLKMAWSLIKALFIIALVTMAPLTIVLLLIYGVAVMAGPILIIGAIGYFIGKAASESQTA